MIRAIPQGAIANLMQEMRAKPAWIAHYTDADLDNLICHSISQRGTAVGHTRNVFGDTHTFGRIIEIANRYFDSRNL